MTPQAPALVRCSRRSLAGRLTSSNTGVNLSRAHDRVDSSVLDSGEATQAAVHSNAEENSLHVHVLRWRQLNELREANLSVGQLLWPDRKLLSVVPFQENA